jgi:tetrahydromethanopterin S-methyltransferase subunit D
MMTTWFHTAVLATSLAATLAIGLASAAIYEGNTAPAAPKTDRLPIVADSHAAYVTVETRGAGVSVLNRIRTEAAD